MSKTCANCGADIPEGAPFCDNCGMPVSETEPQREKPPSETSTPPSARQASPVSTPEAPRRREPLAEGSGRPAPPAPPPPPAIRERRPEAPRRRRVPIFLGMIAILLGMGAAAWFLVPSLRGGETLKVPPLEGRTLEEARREVGGDFELVGDGEPGDVVRSQNPDSGERAARGSEISVVLGSGEVPDVVGRPQEEAKEALRSEGFEVEVRTREGLDEEVGEVLEQSPTGGEPAEGSTVAITVGKEPPPAPGFVAVTDDTGALSLEAPAGWEVLTGGDSETGESSWSSFLGEEVGASVTAAPDLDAWAGSVATGVYVVASRTLAEGYTDEEIVTSGINDFSAICTLGEGGDLEGSPYLGRVRAWNDCGGDPDASIVTVAAAPEDRECVVAMQFGITSPEDIETAQHILDTVEVDCGGIAANTSPELAQASEQAPAG